MIQEGGVPKGPAGLETHGRDKVRCGVKERDKCQTIDVK
jgi:hypothetical protein